MVSYNSAEGISLQLALTSGDCVEASRYLSRRVSKKSVFRQTSHGKCLLNDFFFRSYVLP